MSKPWEETWELERIATGSQGTFVRLLTPDGQLGGLEESEGKLAAQAPAMARLLLELSSQDRYDGGARRCISCGEFGGVHSDCRLERLLRAAGVLP